MLKDQKKTLIFECTLRNEWWLKLRPTQHNSDQRIGNFTRNSIQRSKKTSNLCWNLVILWRISSQLSIFD